MRWIVDLSIRSKMILIVGLGILGTVTYVVGDLVVTRANLQRFTHIQEVQYPVLVDLAKANAELTELRQLFFFAATTGDDLTKEIEPVAARFRGHLQQIGQLDISLVAAAAEWTADFERYMSAAAFVSRAMFGGDADERKVSEQQGVMADALKHLQESLEGTTDKQQRRFRATIAQANQAAAKRLRWTLLVGLLVAVGMALIGVVVVRVTTKSLGAIVQSLGEFAEGSGDLTRKMEQDSRDETGEVVNRFNTFIDRLRAMVEEVANTTRTLSGVTYSVTTAINETSDIVVRQHQDTQQVAVSTDEMAATVQEVARNAHNAANSAKEADVAAHAGQELLDHAVKTFGTLSEEMNGAADVVRRLDEGSSSIGAVLVVIKDIAEQTNLLALNASIEAARAGEHGRGFSVVADEVRTLSHRTQQSTQEIQNLIQRLQESARFAVDFMERGHQQTKDGYGHLEAMVSNLSTVLSMVRKIANVTMEIAAATEEQSHTASDISDRVASISRLADQADVTVRSLNNSREDLVDLNNRLESLIGRFVV